jgi:hypothetical protein
MKNDAKEIAERLCSFPGFFEMIDIDRRLCKEKKEDAKRKIKEKYIEEIKKIQNNRIRIVPSDEKILVVTEKEDIGLDDFDYIYYDLSMLDLSEKDKIKEGIDIEDIYDFKNPMYDILFSKRNEVLGMKIASYNFEKYDEILIAACIIKAITAFGIEEENRNERIDEIVNDLKKSMEQFDKGEYISADDLWEKLGFEKPSPEEEAKRKEEIRIRVEKEIKDKIKVIKEVLEKEGVIL